MRFVDTNVLVYAVATDDPRKRDTSRQLLRHHDLALSTQVLQEFFVVATGHRQTTPLQHADARDLVRAWRRFPVQPITDELVLASIVAADRWQLSYWDAAIIEAARSLACDEILSEDLSHEQDYGGIRVSNPFATS